jgi:hypothetical protein
VDTALSSRAIASTAQTMPLCFCFQDGSSKPQNGLVTGCKGLWLARQCVTLGLQACLQKLLMIWQYCPVSGRSLSRRCTGRARPQLLLCCFLKDVALRKSSPFPALLNHYHELSENNMTNLLFVDETWRDHRSKKAKKKKKKKKKKNTVTYTRYVCAVV